MSGLSTSGQEGKKTGVPFLRLDQNSENYKNWKNIAVPTLSREEDEKRAQMRAELLSRVPAGSKGRTPHADGDFPDDELDLFLDTEPEPTHNKHGLEGNRPNKTASLQPEVTLAKMGYIQDNSVDWSEVAMPLKTDLHKLLHYRISNYINPDILIKIGNHEYRCHLLVLQCYSAYFSDKPVERIEIPETCVTKTAFMYTYDWMLHLGQDSYQLLNRDNILEIFTAAQFLGVKELEEQCWAFIDNEDLFSEDRAFLLYLDARKHGNTSIMELMVPRVQRFFLTLVSSKDYLELSVEEVCVFLKSNYICIHGEIEVFMSAVRWLMYDWENRRKFLIEIMRCIRFGLIAPWQLVDIRRNPESEEFLLVTKSADVSRMIEDGLAFAIIKYWYGHETTEYYHWIDLLGLIEPIGRNWAGTDKNYLFYRDFLTDLDNYRRVQKLEKKHSKTLLNVETEESNESSDTAAVTGPPPVAVGKKGLPFTMMAALMARREPNSKGAIPARHSTQ